MHGKGHGCACEAPDLTYFDAPRRRTEPAITVPPFYFIPIAWQRIDHGHYIEWRSTDGTSAYQVGGSWHSVPPERHVWSSAEVESAKAHGSAAYACMAADCDQVRELLAVEEAKAEMEAWRLRNAEWLDWLRDSDHDGMNTRAVAAFADEERAWLDALTPPHDGETLGDWVARMPPRFPGPFEGREYMQHLYDKLGKGEVVGGE